MPIVSDSLVLHLDANDPVSYTGTPTTWNGNPVFQWNDISGNNRNFILTGSATNPYSGPTFTNNPKKINFDGTNDYGRCSSFSLTNPFTICAWVYKRADVAWASIIDRWTGNENTDSMSFGFDGSNGQRLLYQYNNVNPWNNRVTGNSIVPKNSWHYVCLTATSTSCTFYINGVSDGTFAVTAAADSGDYYIGVNFPGGDEYYRGDLGAIQIYNRVLSASEILQNYNETKSTYVPTPSSSISTSGLRLYLDSANTTSYPGSGTTWFDLSGNGRNATLYNNPSFVNTNKSFLFNGSSNYAEVGALTGTFTSYTSIVFFLPTSVQNYRNPIDGNFNFYPSTGNVGPRLEMNNSGNLTWVYSGNSGDNNSFYSHQAIASGLQSNQWHFAALTHDGTINQSVAYYNGEAVNFSRSSSGNPATPNPSGFVSAFNNVNIGRGFRAFGERYFQGYVRAVLIYDRVLSNDEINQVYNKITETAPPPGTEISNFYVETLGNIANSQSVEVSNFYVESLGNIANNQSVEVSNFYVESLGNIANNQSVEVSNFYVEVLISQASLRRGIQFQPKVINFFGNGLLPTNYGFMVLRYDWSAGDGDDLDTATYITNTNTLIPDPLLDGGEANPSRVVGYGTQVVFGNYSLGDNRNFLTWAGDNTSGDGEEEVLINFDQIINDYPNLTSMTIRAGGRWYGTRASGNVIITAYVYDKSSSFTDSGTSFTSSNSPSQTISVTKNLAGTNGSGPFPLGDDLLYIDINLLRRTISFRDP